MAFSTTSFSTYDICAFEGELRVAELPTLTPYLLTYTQLRPAKDLVFDLSAVTAIDSSAIGLMVNLKKRLEELHRTVYLLKPSKNVRGLLRSVNLDKVLSIIDSHDQLRRQAAASALGSYLPYSTPEDGLLRFAGGCAVCGSGAVIGYLIDTTAYDWRWNGDDPFPASYLKGTDDAVDVFGLMPIVCTACFMSSVEVSHFHAVADGKIRIHSSLDEQSKLILAKSIKKRKRMMESGITASFVHPRADTACFMAYALAEQCARSMAVSRVSANLFQIGLLNYLAIRYADNESKDELIGNCRTWLAQVFDGHWGLNHEDLAKAYFIFMNASLNLNKVREASRAYKGLCEMVNSLPAHLAATGLDSPRFWLTQAHRIWQKEIESRSQELSV